MNVTPFFQLKESLLVEQVDSLRIPLVDRFYQSHGYNIKCGRNERIFTLSHPEHGILAAARLVPQLEDYWLRNLLVAKVWRAHGFGRFFMQTLLLKLESGDCYCFALTHLEQFYLELHFQHLEPENINASVAKRYLQYRARGRDWLLMGYRNTAK